MTYVNYHENDNVAMVTAMMHGQMEWTLIIGVRTLHVAVLKMFVLVSTARS